MQKLAIGMAKGGVGKTTTAVNLAHGLALKGKTVLLIDCDTQGHSAKFLGVESRKGLYEFVTGKDRQGNSVSKMECLSSARHNVFLLSGGMSLIELKNWLHSHENGKEKVLSKKLNPKEGMVDYVIFDCSPGWDILSLNILSVVDNVLCPVKLSAADIEGVKEYMKYISSAKSINPNLEIKYILPTMFDTRTRQCHEILDQLKKHFGDMVLDPINSNVKVSEAVGHKKTVFEYSEKSRGAQDYQKLVRRILKDGGR
jgi:chromosome partitioning protein